MRLFRKKVTQPMEEWRPGMDMSPISVSPEDAMNGSPLPGDMIATNPKNNDDKWLVAAQFMADNYEEVTS
jgi:hypothetical protein